MRGEVSKQAGFFSYVSPEQRVPENHPLRTIKSAADECLAGMERTFESMYSREGRPSIPPERLLKAQLLQALFTVRSDRLFCEQLDYNILFRWFLDMSLDEATFVPTVFSKNRERLLKHEVAQEFFDRVVSFARERNLLSDEHFTVDGTLIEAWASMKSFQRKGQPPSPPEDSDPGNPTVDFKGERRSNETHESTTDPEARLARKGPGKETKLAFTGHVLMENRNGLCVQYRTEQATGRAEPAAALEMLARERPRMGPDPTLGADKGYHTAAFVKGLRDMDICPHVAQISGRRTVGLDGRTTRHETYRLSQRYRKLVEEIFGWGKVIGGFRKTRFVGLLNINAANLMVLSAYNLLRVGRLAPT